MISFNAKPPNGDHNDTNPQVPPDDEPVPTPNPVATASPPAKPEATKAPAAAPPPTATRPAPDQPLPEVSLAPRERTEVNSSGSAAPATLATPTALPAPSTNSPVVAATAVPAPVGDVQSTAVHPAIAIGLVLVWILALVRLGCAWRGRVNRRREDALLREFAADSIQRAWSGRRRHLRSVD